RLERPRSALPVSLLTASRAASAPVCAIGRIPSRKLSNFLDGSLMGMADRPIGSTLPPMRRRCQARGLSSTLAFVIATAAARPAGAQTEPSPVPANNDFRVDL